MKTIFLVAIFIALFSAELSPITVNGIIRDFKYFCDEGGHIDMMYPGRQPNKYAFTKGFVSEYLNANGFPTLISTTGELGTKQFDSADSFAQLWQNNEMNKPLNYTFIFNIINGTELQFYEHFTQYGWNPIDHRGWADPSEIYPGQYSIPYNNLYTVYLKFKILYTEGCRFEIRCDDDCWAYINNQLAIDGGGYHLPVSSGYLTLENISSTYGMGLETGNEYDVSIFMCDRYATGNDLLIRTNCQIKDPNHPIECVKDTDNDGITDCFDNCPTVYNPDQKDCDNNGIGDACEENRSPETYPYYFIEIWNHVKLFNDSNLFGLTEAYQNSPYVVEFIDGIPNNTIHSGDLTIDVVVYNPNDTHDCYVRIDFNGQHKAVYITGVNGTYTKVFDNIASIYKYKYPPRGAGSVDPNGGKNVITFLTETQGCYLQYGAVAMWTKYNYWVNDTNGDYYHSKCVNKVPCLYGTYRFGPRNDTTYCACWSGAWDRSCIMDGGYPGTNISKPWTGNSRWEDIIDLDASNTVRDFGKDWKNHPTCPDLNNWVTVKDLETQAPPTMENAYFQDARLNIWIGSPLTNGRAETVAFLNDASLNRTIPECTYPISQYIFKQVYGCKDVFHFDLPWDIAKYCHWKIVEEESWLVYKGQVILQHQEWLDEPFNEWRFTQAVLRIKLRFQRYVIVNINDTTVYNNPNVTAAITKQIVAVNLGDPTIIELVTLLSYPFKLNPTVGTYGLTQAPPGKVQSVQYKSADCPNGTVGSQCRQRWDQYITLTDGTCTLDGTYQLRWYTTCFPEFPCPYLNQTTSVSFTLQSENFCAEILVDVGLTGELKVYGDAGYNNPKTSFVVGARAYFVLSIESELNTPTKQVVSFSKTTLVTVSIKVSTSPVPVILYQNKAPVDFPDPNTDPKVDIQVDNTLGPKKVGFSFLFTKELAKNLGVNGVLKFNISAEAQATYSQTKKREILQDEQDDKAEFATVASMDATGITDINNESTQSQVSESKNGETSTNGSFTSLVASLFMLALALLN